MIQQQQNISELSPILKTRYASGRRAKRRRGTRTTARSQRRSQR